MQEKEMMTQPRTDTAVLSQSAKDLSGYFMRDLPISKRLIEIADRLEEQEATIHKQRDAIKELERCISEDAAEIATLRKTIGEQEETIQRLKAKAELFDELTRIE